MRLLDFALRQVEKGHDPWSRRKKVFAIAIPIALLLVAVLSAHLYLSPGSGFDFD